MVTKSKSTQMVYDSDTDTWQWQCHVSHRNLTCGIFIFFQKIKKNIFFLKT